MDGRPTFFVYTVFAIDRWISRVDASNTCCQSSPSNTESPFHKTVRVAMADRLRRRSPRGVHALPRSPRRASALQKRASACPNALTAPLPLSRLLRAQRQVHGHPPFLTTHRRHRACSPPRKRVAQLVCGFAVIPSTFSAPPSIQLYLGKGEIVVSFHRRHG